VLAIAEEALTTVSRPEEAAHWPSCREVWNGTWSLAPCWVRLSKRDSNFMLEQGQRGACSFTSRNAPARLVPGVDLLEDFSTKMRGSRVHVLFRFSCGVINGKGRPLRMSSSDAFAVNVVVERTPRYQSRLI
jgi:hypothetical protein